MNHKTYVERNGWTYGTGYLDQGYPSESWGGGVIMAIQDIHCKFVLAIYLHQAIRLFHMSVMNGFDLLFDLILNV